MAENKFWVAKSCYYFGDYMLFNKIPHKRSFTVYADWCSRHGNCYLGKQSWNKFADMTCDSGPIPVRLVPTDSDTPDFYVQRYRDSLFIGNRLIKYTVGLSMREVKEVNHCYRISNKLFPEITEECGPVKFNIERI